MDRRPEYPNVPQPQEPTPAIAESVSYHQPTPLPTKPFPFWRLLILRSIGNFLVLFSLFGIGAILGPALFYEIRFQIDNFTGVHYVVGDQKVASQLGSMSNNTHILTPPDTY